MEVGILNKDIFRLLRNGTVLRDGEVIGDGKHSLLVTDDGVFVDGKKVFHINDNGKIEQIISLSAGPATEGSILVRNTLEYRYPFLVQRQTTTVLGENGCPAGQLRTPDGCVFSCSGFVSEDGKRCYPELPAHMKVSEGRFAGCAFGFELADNGWECECEGVVSLDGKTCQ